MLIPQLLEMFGYFNSIKITELFLIFLVIDTIYAGINNLHTYDTHTFDSSGDVFFEIVDLRELEYTYRIKPAKDFGGSFNSDTFRHKQRNILMLTEPHEACTPIENSRQLAGNIALINRGECSFITKTIMAEDAGAIGVIITDTKNKMNDDYFIEMIHDNSSRDTEIPAGYLLGRDGRMIVNTLDSYGLDRASINLPLNLTFTPPELVNHPPWAMT